MHVHHPNRIVKAKQPYPYKFQNIEGYVQFFKIFFIFLTILVMSPFFYNYRKVKFPIWLCIEMQKNYEKYRENESCYVQFYGSEKKVKENGKNGVDVRKTENFPLITFSEHPNIPKAGLIYLSIFTYYPWLFSMTVILLPLFYIYEWCLKCCGCKCICFKKCKKCFSECCSCNCSKECREFWDDDECKKCCNSIFRRKKQKTDKENEVRANQDNTMNDQNKVNGNITHLEVITNNVNHPTNTVLLEEGIDPKIDDINKQTQLYAIQ